MQIIKTEEEIELLKQNADIVSRTLALVAEFLSDKDNASILSEISEAIEQNDK